MATTALEEFVREALNRGAKAEAITTELIAAGWPKREIESALAQWSLTSFGLAAPKPKTYVSAREAFLYIVMFSLLGLVAFNLGSLLFALIDSAIADVLDMSSQYARHSQIRGALSALAVATPLLAGFGWYIARERRTNAAMQQSRVRKWLTYVTLIVAALVFVGDLIALVYNFMSGDLSERLLLKLIVVGVIAAGVFVFFVRDVEADRPRGGFGLAPALAALGAIAVAAAFAAGTLSIENPIAAREFRLDEARLEALKRVAAAAQCAYSFTDRIPGSYKEVRADFEERRIPVVGGSCTAVPFTPEDEAAVAYRVDDAAHISLCTTFRRPSREGAEAPIVAPYGFSAFPELDERRSAAGSHCYRIRMVKLPPVAALPEPPLARPTPRPATEPPTSPPP